MVSGTIANQNKQQKGNKNHVSIWSLAPLPIETNKKREKTFKVANKADTDKNNLTIERNTKE